MNINKIDLTKNIVNAVVGLGVWRLVDGIIENNVETDSKTDKVVAKSTAIVIAAIAKEKTKTYTDRKIDELVAGWNELKSSLSEPID